MATGTEFTRCKHVLDDELRRRSCAIIVYSQPVDEVQQVARRIIYVSVVEGDRAQRLPTRALAHFHFQMSLPDDPPIHELEEPVKARLRETLPPRACIA